MQTEIFIGNLNGFDYYLYPNMDDNGKFETTFLHARHVVDGERMFGPLDVCLPPAEIIDDVIMEMGLPAGDYWINSSVKFADTVGSDKTVHGMAFDSVDCVFNFPEKAKVIVLHRVPEKE